MTVRVGRVAAAAALSAILTACSVAIAGHPSGSEQAQLRNPAAASAHDFARWDVCSELGPSSDVGTLAIIPADSQSQPAAGCDQQLETYAQVGFGEITFRVDDDPFTHTGSARVISGVDVWAQTLAGEMPTSCFRIAGTTALNVSVSVNLSHPAANLPTACQIADAAEPSAVAVVRAAKKPTLRMLPTHSVTSINVCGALADTQLVRTAPFRGAAIESHAFDSACEVHSFGLAAYLSDGFGEATIDGSPETVAGHHLMVDTHTGGYFCEDVSTQQKLPGSGDHELLILVVTWQGGALPPVCNDLPTYLAQLLTAAGLH